jgi:splicing factor 3B subunit 1
MVMETIMKVVAILGASDIDEWLEVRLVDGGTVLKALGTRVKPHLT